MALADKEQVSRTPIFLMTNTLEVGGSERQFCALSNALDPATFQIQLGCMRRFGPLQEAVRDIAEFLPRGSFFSFQAVRAHFRLGRYLRANRTLIAHSFDFYSNLMLIPTAQRAGVPVVIGSHRQLGDLLTRFQFAAQNAAFRFCDRVVCNSQAAAERLSRAGLRADKLVIIPNGIPDALFAEVSPALPRSEDVMRIGCIGRMNNPVKNHPLFLRAAARVAASFPAVQFLLVGDGPLRPDLEGLADRLGLRHRVEFLGERDDIPSVLAALDISVVTSSSESLSNVILESMAAGVSVIATDVGGNRELVRHGETGLLISPSEDQLVDAMQLLLSQPELRRQFTARSRRFARDHFGLDQIRRRYEQLYTTLIAEKRAKPVTG